MCVLWITTYTLVLIGTKKYKYPLISPITQVITAPLEFSVLFLFIKLDAFRLEYASIVYLYWSIIEIIIVVVMIKSGYIGKIYRVPYIIAIASMTAIMIYWVTIKECMYFFSYLNTFIGIFIWMIFVIKNKDYPMKPIVLAIFLTKFIADICAYMVYHSEGNWAAKSMCVGLPVLDFVFILVYGKRKMKSSV